MLFPSGGSGVHCPRHRWLFPWVTAGSSHPRNPTPLPHPRQVILAIIPSERIGATFHSGEHNKNHFFRTKLGWTTFLWGRKAVTDHDNEIVQQALKMLLPHLYRTVFAYTSDIAVD